MEYKHQEYIRRILIARMSILSRNGFFGLLLMHLKFALDDSIETAATDGEKIYFAPNFLDEINDNELIFILMHEIMHVVLRHTSRTGERNNLLFNVACDIVVNSNILYAANMEKQSITLRRYGESMHIAPDGMEGFYYTAEEVYEMLLNSSIHIGLSFNDNHSRWGTCDDEAIDSLWKVRIKEAYEASKSENSKKSRGQIPLGVERALKELFNAKTDWRVLLNDFVQEEVVDYSFAPPDRRMTESPFFMPDFNETDNTVKNILFMVDTSASMTEDEITQAYSEIKGAIDQYGGRLEGWIGFFDAKVIQPQPFYDENDFKAIQPKGGGGTSFKTIFDYIREEMSDVEITSLVIMTDGYAPFPEESETMGIPVLWMINNEDVTPPWGRVARI